MDLAGKNIVVTGGSMGIGFATASAFADLGCNVAICSRSEKEVKEAGKKINAFAMQCDVSKTQDVKRFFLEVKKKFGHIDIMVNNAGILGGHKDFADTAEKEWNATINVNLRGMMLCTQHALPLMGKGIIINISSGAGKTGFGQMAAYCATKFGVIGFSESLAEELKGIKVYAICPGGVDTRMWGQISGHRPLLKPHHIAPKIIETCMKEPRSGSSIEAYSIPEKMFLGARQKLRR